MSAPAVPVSDEVAAHRLLAVSGELAGLLAAVPPQRQAAIDGVLIELDRALSDLGYEFPEGPDGECLWWTGPGGRG